MKRKKMKCRIYNSFAQDMNEYVRKSLQGHDVKVFSSKLTKRNIDPNTEVLSTFIDSKITKEVFDQLPKLKIITTLSTGYDHVDLKEARRRKIPVCNVPNYGEFTVAQFAMALLLALAVKLYPSFKRVKEGMYDYHGLRGFDLQGKTVGVIGTGRIGLNFIKMMNGLQSDIIAYDAFPNKDLQTEYNFRYKKMNELLAKSDVISLHVPLLPSTYHLINRTNIKKIKKGAYIVNTARGAVIDPEALVWALETEHIAGAALDVMEDEHFVTDPQKLLFSKGKEKEIKNTLMNNIIIDHPKTVITPHNAFNNTEAMIRIYDTSAKNLQDFLKGKVQNDVTKK